MLKKLARVAEEMRLAAEAAAEAARIAAEELLLVLQTLK